MSTKSITRAGKNLPTIFDDFFRPWNEWFDNGGSLERALTVPAVNITENKNGYQVSLAAPGMEKNDFNIDVEGNMITISSEKEDNLEEKDSRYTRREYSYSSFSRSFHLPDEVNQDKIEATYTDGVLNVMLPKKEEAKKAERSKQISIK